MNERRIIAVVEIVAVLALVAACQDVARAQTTVEYDPSGYDSNGPVFMELAAEDCSQPKPVYGEPDAWMQPQFPAQTAPMEMVPIMPLPESAGPRPGMGGEMFGAPGMAMPMNAPMGAAMGAAPMTAPPGMVLPPAAQGAPQGPLDNIAPGGAISPQFGLPAGPEPIAGLANPIIVPATNDEVAWDQIVDVVTDYFTVTREQQVRRSGESWSEGRIETAYQGGAGWLQPFRKDSVGSFNRWESTFQTIRRKALVRVMPDANGFQVEVIVEKELEDLPHPERAMAGAAAFRFDQSLPSDRAQEVGRTFSSDRWLPLGRDAALEAKMLADIQSRLSGVGTASNPSIWPAVWP
jgi:hypothetical protein